MGEFDVFFSAITWLSSNPVVIGALNSVVTNVEMVVTLFVNGVLIVVVVEVVARVLVVEAAVVAVEVEAAVVVVVVEAAAVAVVVEDVVVVVVAMMGNVGISDSSHS